MLRATGTTSLARAVTAAGGAIDPNITFELRTLEAQLADSLIQERLLALLPGFFGAVALATAAIGFTAWCRWRSPVGATSSVCAWRSAPDPRRIVWLVLRDLASSPPSG